MFVRDDNAQKAFSKLRSAIGGLYFYRAGSAKNAGEYQRVMKEAEFAFKQSFAFCPYSPEAVFKYVNLLVNLQRVDEAEMIVRTCIEFDEENRGMRDLLANLAEIKKGHAAARQTEAGLSAAENKYRTNPSDLTAGFDLASYYLSLQQTNNAFKVFQEMIDRPDAPRETVLSVANAYSQLGNMIGLEAALSKLVKSMPESPEAWYDLSRAQTVIGKGAVALQTLSTAIHLSEIRIATNPTAKDLKRQAPTDASFGPIRNTPEFQKLVTQNP